MRRVLVLGGYGAFGGRVAERLARELGLGVIVAGRSEERARIFACELGSKTGAEVVPVRMDGGNVSAQELAALAPAVLINASGPYQGQDYRLARACIAASVHYVDLADARAFATGIAVLDDAARSAGVLVVSGASSLPALSSAVLDVYVPHFASLEAAAIVIAPGNSFDPGVATTQSILGTLGRPIAGASRNTVQAYGWQDLRRRALPGLGARWIGQCDVPDLDLFPRRYRGLRRVRVYAALEVGAFHLALWGLSWLVRLGAVRRPERLAAPLLGLKHRLGFLGTDRGGMVVTLEGRGKDGNPMRLDWRLIAGSGHGPYVPAIPSVLLAKRLLSGAMAERGAKPCVGLFTLADFLAEVADLDITAGLA